MDERVGGGRDRVGGADEADRDAGWGRALRAALHDAPDGVPDPARVEAAAGLVAAVGVAPPVDRSRRGMWLAAGVVAVLLVGVTVGWQIVRRGGSEPAGVPVLQFTPAEERDPRVLLAGLAERAERQSGPGGSGPWLHRVGRQWAFQTSMNTRGHTIGAGVGEQWSQSWSGADGAVRGRRVTTDPPRGGWEPLSADEPAEPGGPALPQVGAVSAEQVREWLIKQVRTGTSTSPGDERSTAQWFRAVAGGRAADDPVFAAVAWRILASLPGITVEGQTRDRAGRPAVAVSVVAEQAGGWFPRQRLYLLFDSQTGLLLAGETVALAVDENAVGTSVSLPVTTAYQLWFAGVFVADKYAQPFLGPWSGAVPASAVAAVRGRAWCFRSADPAGQAEPVGTGDPGRPDEAGNRERGPVEVCSSTWQTDRYGWVSGTPKTQARGNPSYPVPALAACVLTERVPGTESTTVVGVFPGGEGTCAALGLPGAQ
ncbi:hypothetical protein ACQPZF_26440 [Actinosynnema sp. CS-041913]|uniref:hypothetical protein n=1 Tax=Actinosynnema sp. CS-041913 TaxID=3239917 RepID=UPI003D919829